MLIQTVVTLFTRGIHRAKFGTKCLPGMILIAKIKSLLVNKKRKKIIINNQKSVEHGCQHF